MPFQKSARTILALCCFVLLQIPQAAQASLTDAERTQLAKSFVSRLKSIYHRGGEQPEVQQRQEPGAEENRDALNYIPDGENLLLKPSLGYQHQFSDNVPGLKENGKVYLSFADFIDILYFAIDYDHNTQSGAGWFLREDWTFSVDFNARTVVSKGESFAVADDDIYMDGGEVLASTEALERWFGIGLKPDLMSQMLQLESDYPFPVIAREARERRQSRQAKYLNVPEYPLQESEYKWLDINTAQVSSSNTFRRRENTENDRRHTANLVTQGDLLKHSYYSTAAFNNNDGFNSLTGRLYRQSQEPELLGPLKARAYYIGDVEQTTIPLTPTDGHGLGFNVTNNPLQRIDFRTTAIRGNAIPGWDVELYRNDSLVGLVTVDDSGRYAFEEVELFAGENDFELLFFGPQGEIRREKLEIPVNADVLGQQNNVYEFAATLQERQTYQKRHFDDPDKNNLHLSGRYNFFTGDVLNYVGLRSLSVEGEDKIFASTGFTATRFKTLIDGFLAMDEEGEARVGTQLRRNFDDLDLSLRAEVATDEYSTSGSTDPNVISLGARARQKLHFLPGKRNTLSAEAEYNESASGLSENEYLASLASQYGGLNVSNTLRYRNIETGPGTENKEADLITGFRGRLGSNKFFWRVQSDYQLQPEKEFDELLFQLKYKHNKEWSGDFEIEHEPPESFTEYRVGANWHHKNFMLTPFVEYDTNHELFTGVNLRFAAVDDGEGLMPRLTSQSVFGQGFVSAFVYHDKNGDLVFNGDDEPIPGVMVVSKNVVRRAETDESGIALVSPLPANYRTDIDLDAESLPEPFMISKYVGRSVSLKPGETVKIEMPVQSAGEIDGTVYLRRKSGTLEMPARQRVHMLPLENDMNQTLDSLSLYEGLFVFSRIPAGRYYLIANAEDAAKEGGGRSLPRLVTIGYDAPVIYGQDITLVEGLPDIGFGVLSEEEAYRTGLAPVADRRMAAPYFFISMDKPGGSRLLNALYSFGAQKRAAQYVAGLRKVWIAGAGGEERFLYLVPGNSLEEAYARCGKIVALGSHCRVDAALPPSEVFVVSKQGISTAQNSIPVTKEKVAGKI